MKSVIKVIKKNYYKYKHSMYFRARFIYTKYYEKLDVIPNTVLLQSYDGSSVSGNPYYILKELVHNSKYKKMKIYVVSDHKNFNKNCKFLINKNFDSYIEIVKIHTKRYCELLASCQYLINNSTFAPYFIKKEGQIYLNTWHGTPLKHLGRKIYDAPNEIGNTQRNFLMADYLLYPNDFTYEHMTEDYMIRNYYKGKYIVSGYPRNSIFFDVKKQEEIKKQLELSQKKIIVYMPTWRGTLVKKDNTKQHVYIMHMLYELDKAFDDNVVMFVKLHSLGNFKIPFDSLEHIKAFPNTFETYELLSIADCLITDYSSVLFDYANTGRKIILYGYDFEEYMRNKGTYFPYNDLPFVFVKNVDEMLYEIKHLEKYDKYNSFNLKYNIYDSIDAAEKICDLVFCNNDKNIQVYEGKMFNSTKDNVFVFGGSMAKNGITTALRGLLKYVDKSEKNYILTFYKTKTERNKYVINDFDFVDYMPIQGSKNMTMFEAIIIFLYFRIGMRFFLTHKIVNKIFKRELKRLYPNIQFKYAIHYSGYEKPIIYLIDAMEVKKIIYIHNDMRQEQRTKKNFDLRSFKYALQRFDNIICIRDTSKNEVMKMCKKINKAKVVVAHNLNDIETIKQKAKANIILDDNTYCNVSNETLNSIMSDDSLDKIVNIGRYSPEKGHKRLIDAFVNYYKQNSNSYLIIIGGDGRSFKETQEYVANMNNSHIILIKNISNPYPILSKACCFILSSYYEGLPMTIMEALILNRKVISTDIVGPREFLGEGYGFLVDNSEEGILQGLLDYKSGKLNNLKKFDAEKFNEQALQEFYDIIEK